RFYAEEEKDDPVFAARLAAFADIYVNDAFGTAHRAHASTEGIARLLPAVAGFLMEKEILFLGRLLENPGRPYLAVLGGAKVSDKLKVIKNLLGRVDAIAIGGAMAYTFLKAGGARVGMSLVEDEMLGSASEIMEAAASKKVIFLLPSDHVVASAVSEDAAPQAADEKGIPEGLIGLDIGPETVKKYGEVIKTAKTIFWNGPMGVFEMKPFSKGTYEVAAMIAASGATTVVGGGDSISALKKSGYEDKISHISTGGGASLEFLEGLELPGIKALNNR
ncbi:MAG: phosphoglycerate kinase, partial [Lentisphaerae bacterium GWF2_52_8]